jgi:aspartate/methionine/tyrosine aminotransferase
VAYAPTAGVPAIREAWKQSLLSKNPSLKPENITLPALVPGITAGLSYIADLFLDAGQTIILSDPCWDNYPLLFEERRNARLRGVKMFTKKGFDADAVLDALKEEAKTGVVRVIFNFPNNPSGYTPTKDEAEKIIDCCLTLARADVKILALCDDAYFGFFYEPDTLKESLFARLACLHDNILAVKIDGPTKEDYVWGLRLAFVTFGMKDSPASQALVTKLTGCIRSSASCANTPAQHIFLRAATDSRTANEKQAGFDLLKGRYLAVKKCVEEHAGHRVLSPLPFNSGYFMTFHTNGVDAEKLRRHLLDDYKIGVVALQGEYIRVAFSSLDEEVISETFTKIYRASEEV